MNSKVDVIYHFGNLNEESVGRFKRSVASLNRTNISFRLLFSDAGFEPSINKFSNLFPFFSYHFEKYTEPYNRSLTINNAFRYIVKSPFVLVLDIDLLVEKNFLEKAIERYNKEKKLICFNYRRLKKDYKHTIDHEHLLKNYTQNHKEPNQSSLFFAPTSLIHKYNGLDEEYVGWGGEDTDFNHRLRRGNSFYFARDMVILHQYHEGKDIAFKNKMKPYIDANIKRYEQSVESYNKGKEVYHIKGIKDLRT